ncbi:MAG: zinc-dependent metalloprotease [Chloroflexota bacterium]|nr:zinc-dependent metalloprotease [Chloroflexota bacterium]MDQ5866191.1 zinc-dependent metalloprotease [Chloroflexota bacterium]
MATTRRNYDPRLLGLGLLAAGALGAAWVNKLQKQYEREGAPRLLDWERVRAIAHQIVREEEAAPGWHGGWEDYYREMVAQCYPVITETMGRDLPVPLDKIKAFTRSEWIDANISNFGQLFDHIEVIYHRVQPQQNVGTLIMGEMSQTVLSSQLGILMGYLAKRVLGQYDLSLLGKEVVTTGQLYFVEPNINGVVAELGLDPHDFRLWIALHETTHAYEFEAYPWVREYFNSLLEEYFDYVSDDLVKYGSGLGSLSALIERTRSNMSSGDTWIESVMSPEQRNLFNRLQALMSIVEGYSNFIMNSVGERLLPSYQTIKERVEQRAARRGTAEKLFIRITGLALKMEQYRMGETFINAVVAKRGVEFANRVWEGPDKLPTLEELRNPDQWMSRVGAET